MWKWKQLTVTRNMFYDEQGKHVRTRKEILDKNGDVRKGCKIVKKGELQSKIDRKNEEIDILKIRLSGIAKKYGYKNVQELYHIYHKSHSAYVDYREQVAEWEKTYGGNSQKQTKKVCLSVL